MGSGFMGEVPSAGQCETTVEQFITDMKDLNGLEDFIEKFLNFGKGIVNCVDMVDESKTWFGNI